MLHQTGVEKFQIKSLAVESDDEIRRAQNLASGLDDHVIVVDIGAPSPFEVPGADTLRRSVLTIDFIAKTNDGIYGRFKR